MNPLGSNYYFGYAISIVGLILIWLNAVKFLKHIPHKGTSYRIITMYLILSALIESLCNYIGFFYPGNNIFLTHIVFNLHFGLLSWFFYRLFDSLKIKLSIVLVYVLFILTNISLYINAPALFWSFNLFEILYTSLFLIIYSFLLLYKNLDKEASHYFYLCTGIIIFFTTTSIIYATGDYNIVFMEFPIFLDLWIFNSLSYIVYQYCILKEWKILTNGQSQ